MRLKFRKWLQLEILFCIFLFVAIFFEFKISIYPKYQSQDVKYLISLIKVNVVTPHIHSLKL